MIESMTPAPVVTHALGRMPPIRHIETRHTGMTEEMLPFTLRLVRTPAQLAKAVQIRHSAYARHLPDFAQTLKEPESADAEDGVVVLLAQSKLDGSALGTMRIQSNEFKPLCLEQSVDLPAEMSSRRLAEATRLAVTSDKVGRLVKAVLFKAYFLHCQNTAVDWMVIAGRSPIDRQYDRLLFEDVFPGMGYIPLRHAGNLPHRVMSFHIDSAKRRWAAVNHPMLDFMCHTHHPDIELDLADLSRSGQAHRLSMLGGGGYLQS